MTDTPELFTPEEWSGLLEPDEADEIIGRINTSVETIRDCLAALWEGRAWIGLGYDGWDEMCKAKLGIVPKISPDQRRMIVGDLTAIGMSTRAIAAGIGVHHSTVADDQRGVGNPTPRTDVAPPTPTPTITGTDGKTYTKPTPKPDPWTVEEEGLKAQFLLTGRSIVVSMKGQPKLWAWALANGHAVKIDRSGKLGNPFETPADGDRATVIANYLDHYLPHKPSVHKRYTELRGKILGCWCYPLPCHGDALIAEIYE